MTTLVVISAIFAVCYLFSRPVFSTRWQLLGFRLLFLSGGELLLLGMALGPRGLGLVPVEVLDGLDPVIHLAVGWAGLIFGLQFNRRLVGLYRLRRWALSFAQALFTGIVAACAGLFLVPRVVANADSVLVLRSALLIGICSAVSAPSSIHYFSRVFRIRGRVNRLLKFIVGVDAIPAVVMLGLLASLYHVAAVDGSLWPSLSPWFFAGAVLGVVLGLCLFGLIELELSRDELLLFVLGMVVLAGGLAHYLRLSALFVTFVMGVTVANTAWKREEVHKITAHAEQPIYLTLMFLAGTTMTLNVEVVALGLALVAVRLMAKLIANVPWRFMPFEEEAETPLLGLALLSQGGWAVVLAIDWLYVYRSDTARAEGLGWVASAVLFGVLANELLSPIFIKLLFPFEQPTAFERLKAKMERLGMR